MDIDIQSYYLSPIKKFLLRFAFCYIVLYIIPHGFEYVYAFDALKNRLWAHLIIPFGETFLNFHYDPQNLLIGLDGKYEVTRLALCGILSIIITVIWLFIDLKYALKYDYKLNALFRTILRYHIGFLFILYGTYKLVPFQFFEVMGIERLDSTVGDYNPMDFLWTFMSYSKVYLISTGLIEVIGGLFLLFRPTTLLGSVICFSAMFNVLLLDIGYDTVIKYFAIHVFLMTVLLLLEDIPRLVNLFVLNKPVLAALPPTLFITRKEKQIGYVVKAAILLYFFTTTIVFFYDKAKALENTSNATISSVYNVQEFIINGDTLPPLTTDTVRWKSLLIKDYGKGMLVKRMNDRRSQYNFVADTVRKTIAFHPIQDTTSKYYMQYKKLTDGNVVFYGSHKGDSLRIITKPFGTSQYRLKKYGIRWILDR